MTTNQAKRPTDAIEPMPRPIACILIVALVLAAFAASGLVRRGIAIPAQDAVTVTEDDERVTETKAPVSPSKETPREASKTVMPEVEDAIPEPEPSVDEPAEAPKAPEPSIVDLGYAVAAYHDQHAHDGGDLAIFQPGYYVAHSWSEPGLGMLSLSVGDEFRVDGATYRVSGIETFADYTPVEDVRDVVGWDALILQTCIPDGDGFYAIYASGAGDFSVYLTPDNVWSTTDEYLERCAAQDAEVVEEDVVDEVVVEPFEGDGVTSIVGSVSNVSRIA